MANYNHLRFRASSPNVQSFTTRNDMTVALQPAMAQYPPDFHGYDDISTTSSSDSDNDEKVTNILNIDYSSLSDVNHDDDGSDSDSDSDVMSKKL